MNVVKSIEDIKEGEIVLIKRHISEWLINFHKQHNLPKPEEWCKVLIDDKTDSFLIEKINNKEVRFL